MREAAPGRQEFALADLQEWGLTQPFGTDNSERWRDYGGVVERRRCSPRPARDLPQDAALACISDSIATRLGSTPSSAWPRHDCREQRWWSVGWRLEAACVGKKGRGIWPQLSKSATSSAPVKAPRFHTVWLGLALASATAVIIAGMGSANWDAASPMIVRVATRVAGKTHAERELKALLRRVFRRRLRPLRL